METIKFKTNIMCGSCINTVTPILNGIVAIQEWDIDTTISTKTLTIHTEKVDVTDQIVNSLRDVGYNAEKL